ncbi:MarR family winged helix-turn-helix transcriptional regulator [Embleya sp. NBC_00896]|uniref:MarR family winged helix-turn-helix transcriptional regulator n=1 Tax=Embleya sp. NBC_00896 TaxID=2975961 RepID=UPI00386DFAD1|nr:MarR family transcriptional regulator [Embleya sp. NBC_00896]
MPEKTTSPRAAQAAPAALTSAPGYQIRRLHQAYVAAWVRTVDPVLTGPQYAVLTAVHANPGQDQSSFASAVALDTSTMADVARRLETKGLIVRRTAAGDGRRKLLFLTEEGEKTLHESNVRARALDEKLLAPYDQAERARLLDLLNSLSAHWEGLTEGP